VNRWVNLGVALICFAIVLNVLHLISPHLLFFALAIPGLLIWWLGCLAFAWWLDAKANQWMLDDE
jgi:hypothetical protein